MRTAVILFYWLCAVLLVVLSIHAEFHSPELHSEGKTHKKNSHPKHLAR